MCLCFKTNPTQSGQLLTESLYFRTNPTQSGQLLTESHSLGQTRPSRDSS